MFVRRGGKGGGGVALRTEALQADARIDSRQHLGISAITYNQIKKVVEMARSTRTHARKQLRCWTSTVFFFFFLLYTACVDNSVKFMKHETCERRGEWGEL